jgi:hypothetical protein
LTELFVFYVFGAGYILGQLTAHHRPRQVNTTIWTGAIFTATMLWPIFLTISIVSHILAARRV